MNTFKSLIRVVLALILLTSFFFWSCDNDGNSKPINTSKEKAAEAEENIKKNSVEIDKRLTGEGLFHVGIIQFVQHSALDSVKLGIIESFENAGFIKDENLEINYQNAEGDSQKCQAIINEFIEDDLDLIIAIATPAAEAAGEQKDIPVVFAAVTEPKVAGLVETWETPNTNLTGVSDLTPVEALLDIALGAMLEAKNIGVIYNDAEINSVVQVEHSREIAKSLNINIIEKQASDLEEVKLMSEKLAQIADIVWLPTDNTVLAGIEPLINIMNEHNIPVVGASKAFAKEGAIYATGYDYFIIGLQAGDIAIDILSDTDPAQIPVQTPSDIGIAININAAKEIGYQIPFEMMLIADEVYY